MSASPPVIRPSRRATLRLSSVMGVAVYVAACLGVWRAYGSDVFEIYERDKPVVSNAMQAACGLIMCPIGAVGGISLWLESRRGQGPQTWGVGRWTWAFAGASLLLASLETYLYWTVGFPLPRPPKAYLAIIPYIIKYRWGVHFAGAGGAIPLGTVLIAARWSGSLRDPSPDAREWSGRVLAATVFLTAAAALILSGYGL